MSGGTGLWMRMSRVDLRQRSPDGPQLPKILSDCDYLQALGYASNFHSSVYSANDGVSWQPM